MQAYAGVMKVSEIKLAGYPYRQTYEKFWKYCVVRKYHHFVSLKEDTPAKEACTALCNQVMLPVRPLLTPGWGAVGRGDTT